MIGQEMTAIAFKEKNGISLDQRRIAAQAQWQAKTNSDLYITIGMGTCGIAAGAGDTLVAIQRELEKRGLKAVVSQVGCVGMCSYEPMVELQTKGRRTDQLRRGH